MALPLGSRLGPYEIVAPIGAGGMGEVYRARDTRLGREVAVKVLPHSPGGDPALRFEREAHALAALNHPHIASIHDVIGNDDHSAIVMELVAGPTLAELIAAGPLPLPVAIDYAIDISDALCAAHTAGIVHRDLKPANIVVTKEGTPKVLDFGVAKLAAVTDRPFDQPTTAALTHDRAVIGTVGYMSPEQAHGHSADARSDIFSLGAVMYEALSGRRAFEGDTTAALLSAVIRDDPPRLRTIIPAAPRAIERCVMRCLEKDPRRRYQNAADLKSALEDLREDLTAPEAAHASTTAAAVPQRMLHPLMYPAAGAAIAIAAFTATGGVGPASPITPRFTPFITEMTSATHPVWSPDGRTLAYVDVVNGQRQIFVRGMDASQSTQLTTEPASTPRPFWAPDGSTIYFVRTSDGGLVSVSAGGGKPQPVAEVNETSRRSDAGPPHPVKACISPDGRTIVFTRGEIGAVQLWMLDTRTRLTRSVEPVGMPQTLGAVGTLAFSPNGETLAVLASTSGPNLPRGIWLISWPSRAARHILADSPYRADGSSTISWMPDSRRVLVSGAPVHGGPARVLMVDTVSVTLRPLTGGKDTETSPSVSPDGTRVAFVSERSGMDLIQFPVDGGPPEPLLASSRTESYPDVSPTGLLAYVTDADGYDAVRLRSLSDNWSRPLGGASEPERAAPPGEVRLSPDGRRVAVVTYGEEHLIWIYPSAGGTPVRLDSESSEQHAPSWSPDGNWIAYRRLMQGAFSIVKAPLGGGEIVRLDDANPGSTPTDWSPAGQWVAHSRRDGLHLVAPDGSVPPRVLALHAELFRFSHDGSRLFGVRRGQNRRWELTIWDVTSGRELRVVALPLASVAALQWLALSPDDARIIVSAGANTSDIWLLEEFEPASSLWTRWLSW